MAIYFLKLLGLCFLLTHPFAKAERVDDAMVRKIKSILLHRHPQEGPQWWKDLGDPGLLATLEILKETKHHYQRLRLISALGYFESPKAVPTLKSIAETGKLAEKKTALRSLGFCLELEDKTYLESFLQDSNPKIAKSAQIALEALQSRSSGAHLKYDSNSKKTRLRFED